MDTGLPSTSSLDVLETRTTYESLPMIASMGISNVPEEAGTLPLLTFNDFHFSPIIISVAVDDSWMYLQRHLDNVRFSHESSAIPFLAVSKDWTLRARRVVSAIWCICKKSESSGTDESGRAWPAPAPAGEAHQDSQSVAAGTAAVSCCTWASRRLRSRPGPVHVQNVQKGADPPRAHSAQRGSADGWGVRNWDRIATSGSACQFLSHSRQNRWGMPVRPVRRRRGLRVPGGRGPWGDSGCRGSGAAPADGMDALWVFFGGRGLRRGVGAAGELMLRRSGTARASHPPRLAGDICTLAPCLNHCCHARQVLSSQDRRVVLQVMSRVPSIETG